MYRFYFHTRPNTKITEKNVYLPTYTDFVLCKDFWHSKEKYTILLINKDIKTMTVTGNKKEKSKENYVIIINQGIRQRCPLFN